MSATTQEMIEVLCSAVEGGRTRAQVPEVALWISNDPADEQKTIDLNDKITRSIERAIEEGLVAWSVANPNPMTGKVLYTKEPRNPTTNRLVTAFAFMTPLAVAQYGDELYQSYKKVFQEKGVAPPSEAEFKQAILPTTVPASPAFASQVPADIQAIATPPKAPKAAARKTKIGSDGFADYIGARNAQLIFENRDAASLLQQMENLKIGPNTQFAPSRFMHYENLEAWVINIAGRDGVELLAKKDFPLDFEHYLSALHSSNPIGAMDALEQAGVDPRGSGQHGNLANLWAHARKWEEPGVFEWISQRGIPFTQGDMEGDLPISALLHAISHQSGMVDFFTDGADMSLNGVMQMLGVMGFNEETQKLEALEDLAIQMVESGADISQPNKSGRAAYLSIFPPQERVMKRLYQATDPNSQNREAQVMRGMFGGDRSKIKSDPEMYGPKMLAFIRRLEAASGVSILDSASPSVAQTPKSPRPK